MAGIGETNRLTTESILNSFSRRTITVAGVQLDIPDYYEQIQTLPEDPAESVALAAQSTTSGCFVLIYPIDAESAMPFDEDAIVDGVRSCLDDNQGIIKVKVDETDDLRYVYTIVKTLKSEDDFPAGVQYTLSMDVYSGEQILHIQGFFDEIGTTGVRETSVYNALSTEFPNLRDVWAADPYDPNYKKGALMNVSESDGFDTSFVDHPLSMARTLVRYVTTPAPD